MLKTPQPPAQGKEFDGHAFHRECARALHSATKDDLPKVAAEVLAKINTVMPAITRGDNYLHTTKAEALFFAGDHDGAIAFLKERNREELDPYATNLLVKYLWEAESRAEALRILEEDIDILRQLEAELQPSFISKSILRLSTRYANFLWKIDSAAHRLRAMQVMEKLERENRCDTPAVCVYARMLWKGPHGKASVRARRRAIDMLEKLRKEKRDDPTTTCIHAKMLWEGVEGKATSEESSTAIAMLKELHCSGRSNAITGCTLARMLWEGTDGQASIEDRGEALSILEDFRNRGLQDSIMINFLARMQWEGTDRQPSPAQRRRAIDMLEKLRREKHDDSATTCIQAQMYWEGAGSVPDPEERRTAINNLEELRVTKRDTVVTNNTLAQMLWKGIDGEANPENRRRAKEVLEKLLQEKIGNPATHHIYARVLWEGVDGKPSAEERTMAIAILQKLRDEEQDNIMTICQHARMLWEGPDGKANPANRKEAIAMLEEKLLTEKSNKIVATNILAQMLFEGAEEEASPEDRKRAKGMLEKLITDGTADAHSRTILATWELEMLTGEKQILRIKELLEPVDDGVACCIRTFAFLRNGKMDEAWRECQHALQLPDCPTMILHVLARIAAGNTNRTRVLSQILQRLRGTRSFEPATEEILRTVDTQKLDVNALLSELSLVIKRRTKGTMLLKTDTVVSHSEQEKADDDDRSFDA